MSFAALSKLLAKLALRLSTSRFEIRNSRLGTRDSRSFELACWLLGLKSCAGELKRWLEIN